MVLLSCLRKTGGKVFTLSARVQIQERLSHCVHMVSVFYLVELIFRPIINLKFYVARN